LIDSSFLEITTTKKFPTLFWNNIKSLRYKEIVFQRKPSFDEDTGPATRAYSILLTQEEVSNITQYAESLGDIKTKSSKCITGIAENFSGKVRRYEQGFLAEYAFAKLLLLKFKKKAEWDDSLTSYGKGDKGDIRIKDTIIDIKSKDYGRVLFSELYYDIKATSLKKSDYFTFTYVERLEDGSVLVNILGYLHKDEIQNIPEKEYHVNSFGGSVSYKARRVDYNLIHPIEDPFSQSL
jgi:hypothetical protein